MSKLIKAGTQQEIEQFLYSQSEMLDSRKWRDWIDLFTQDGLYWMPADPADEDGDGIPSIFYEDHYLMRTRMKRLDHPRAWSQSPAPRTSHLISNVQLDAAASTDKELVVRSRFHVGEIRLDKQRYFVGSYTHHLVPDSKSWKIRLQRVDILNYDAPFDYVLQVWL